jgi:hypothetical protein
MLRLNLSLAVQPSQLAAQPLDTSACFQITRGRVTAANRLHRAIQPNGGCSSYAAMLRRSSCVVGEQVRLEGLARTPIEFSEVAMPNVSPVLTPFQWRETRTLKAGAAARVRRSRSSYPRHRWARRQVLAFVATLECRPNRVIGHRSV